MSAITNVRLHAAIAAVAPIDGVAILDPVAHTARIDYKASAIGPQITAGNSALAAFDWSASADTTYIAQRAKAAATASIDSGALQAGVSLERLVRALAIVTMNEINILRAAIPHPITSITRVTTVATVTTPIAHGRTVGDAISIAGADVAGYNLTTTIATVPTGTTFTYTMANAGVTPATGSLSYTLGAVPDTPARVASQIVTAVKAQIALTAE